MTIREMLEQRAKAVADARAIQDKADKEKRPPTAEERQQYDAFMADADRLEGEATTAAEDVERRSRLDRHEREVRESRGRQTETKLGGEETVSEPTAREYDLALRAWALGRKSTPEQRAAADRIGLDYNSQEISVATRSSFDANGKEVRLFLPCTTDAHGNIKEFRYVTPGEHRALSSGTTTAGGDSIPTAMMQRYSEVQKWYARLDAIAEVIRTENGQNLPWPTVTDTANSGRQLGEATTATTTTDPTFSKVTLGAYKISSDAVAVPWELLQDSFLDLSSYLGKALGTRIGRKKNALQTTGAGTTEPKGLITGAAVGVTAAVTNAFTMDETITLEHTVDPAYRGLPGTGFMFHDTIAAYVRKMKDGNGRYLWEPSLQAGMPDRFRGFPVFINNDMDSALTTGKKLLGFGNVQQAFVVRYAGAQRFIRDESIYVKEHMTYFEALERFDSNVVDSTAFKVLALA